MLIIGILLCFFLSIFYFKKSIFNPECIFTFSFFLLLLLTNLGLYDLYSPSDEAITIIIIGIIFFCLGGVLYKALFKVKIRKNEYIRFDNIFQGISKYYNRFIILIIIAIIFEIMYASNSIRYLLQGNNLYSLRYMDLDTIMSQSHFWSLLYTYFSIPVLFILMPIACYEFFVNRQSLLLILTLIATVIYFFSNGARLPFVYFAMNILICFLLNKRSIRSNKNLKKIVFFSIIVVFFIAIISNVRSASVNNDYDFFKSMYRYITGSTINMSEKIKYIQLHKFGTYGAATLYGIFNLLDKFYSLIMNNSLTVIKEAMNFLEVIQTELIYINDGGNLYNFCTTGFLFFYVDFGYRSYVI